MNLEKQIQNLRDQNSPLGDLCDDILFDKTFPIGEGDAAILKYLVAFKERFPAMANVVDKLIK